MMTATAVLLEEIVSVGSKLAVRFDDARRELEAEQQQRRDTTESPMLADKLESLEKVLKETKEEYVNDLSELKNELAAERAAREVKEKEVAALTLRLSQAEDLLSQEKEKNCKLLEAPILRSSCQPTTATDAQDETRAIRKEMENIVKALTAQSTHAEKMRVQRKAESRKVLEAIYLTSEQPPNKTDARIIRADESTTFMKVERSDEPLTDCGLLHLPFLTSVKCLEISHCAHKAALWHLYTMTWLEELKIESDTFDDSVVLGIRTLTALRCLELVDTGVSGDGLAHLTCLGSLKVLTLSRGKHALSAGMVHLGKLTRLEELILSYNCNCWVDLGIISNLKALRRLELIRTGVSDDGLAHLTCLGSLKALVLSQCGYHISSAGLVHVGKLTWLEELKLESHHFDDTVGVGISNLAALRRLELVETHISEDGLAYLTCLGSLKVLILHDYISAAGMVHVGKLTCLEELKLESQISNYSVVLGISNLTALRWLELIGTQVTDAGVSHLTCLGSLKVLVLSCCQYNRSYGSPLSSAGMVHVGQLTNLEALDISTLDVRDDGVKHCMFTLCRL